MHILNAIAFNAYVLSSKVGGMESHLSFRKKLITAIIEKHHLDYVIPKRGRPAIPVVARLSESHFLNHVQPTEKKNTASKRCYVCSANNVRCDTRYQCYICDVGLCAVPCLEIIHTKNYYSSFQ